MNQANLRRRLERVESCALQASTMHPGIRIVFCHARDGRPAGISVFGPAGRLVWLEPPVGCREASWLMSKASPTNMAVFPVELRCLFQASRYKVLLGGRGSAKSWSVARALLLRGIQKPLRIRRKMQKKRQCSLPAPVPPAPRGCLGRP
jgi:hypothetical protein